MQLLEPTYDVAVLGGGWQGFAAARAAARAGLSTILVERRQVLAWESVWASALDWSRVPASDAGLALDAVLRQVGGLHEGRLDNAILEQALDRELTASGAKLLYYAQPVALARDEHGCHHRRRCHPGTARLR